MSVSIYKTVKNTGIKQKVVLSAVKKTLSKIGVKNKDISISFIGRKKMNSLNKRYRKKNRPTDVLSFSAQEGFGIGENSDFGDIFICVPFVEKQAKKQNISYKEECLRMVIHGVLHLAGYDHITKKDEKIMFGIQENILKKMV
ncbi:MAG: rRNA maturation RNase YbeY [Candidatus Magasanikbacteria bacterium]|nr:rRNA maturation RNase YbeY [Candidatus Magasanikbacteria bacterium]